jgi:hypothetical protein
VGNLTQMSWFVILKIGQKGINLLVMRINRCVFLCVLSMLLFFSVNIFSAEFIGSHSVSPKNAKIGDILEYKIEAVFDNDTSLVVPVIESRGVFSVHKYDTDLKKKKANSVFHGVCSFSLYETGEFVIPTMNLYFKKENKAYSYSLPALVVNIQASVSPNQILNIKDIKAPLKLKLNWFRIIAGIIGVLLLALFSVAGVYFFLAKKKVADYITPIERDVRTPYERAKDDLAELKNAGLLEEGNVSESYHRLIEILKTFFSELFAAKFLEMTTDEVLTYFIDKVDAQLLKRIKKILALGDFVKFARYIPEEKVNNEAFEKVEHVVTEMYEHFGEANKKVET